MPTRLTDFYGFTSTPFTQALPSRDLYQTRGLREVHGRLTFALQEHLPALITGDVGTGKSTALRGFVAGLDRNLYVTVYLANPHLTVTTLYRQILLALQVEPAFGFLRLLPQLRATLAEVSRKGRFVLLLVDEAHLLPPELLEQLRFLLNEEMDSTSLLTLVLLGQPELAHKLRFAPYEALAQRIAVRYQLPPFDLEETAGYIKHQLRTASFTGSIFSDGFIAAVHDQTKGVARQINNICRNALLLGATEFKQVLDETDLKRVLLDLEGRIV